MSNDYSQESIRLSDMLLEYLNTPYQEIKNSLKFMSGSRAVIQDISTAHRETKYVYVSVVDHEEGVMLYVGSKTDDKETLSFVESTYNGSSDNEQYGVDCSKYDFFVMCIRVDEDSGELLNLEHDILKQIGCAAHPRFYNLSDRVGGASKSLNNSEKKKNHILDKLKRTRSSEECNDCYPRTVESIKYLRKLKRIQCRLKTNDHGINPQKLKMMKISAEVDGGKEIMKNFRGVIVLKDYFGEGEHLRGGSTHTVIALDEKTKINELETIWIDDHDGLLTEVDLDEIAFSDNAEVESLFDSTTEEERINHCMNRMMSLGCDHKHSSIFESYTFLGGTMATWRSGTRQKLKDFHNKRGLEKVDPIPVGREKIDWQSITEKNNWAQEMSEKDASNTAVVSSSIAGGSTGHLEKAFRWLSGYMEHIESNNSNDVYQSIKGKSNKSITDIPYYNSLKIGTYHESAEKLKEWGAELCSSETVRINRLVTWANSTLPPNRQVDIELVNLARHRSKQNNGVYSDD